MLDMTSTPAQYTVLSGQRYYEKITLHVGFSNFWKQAVPPVCIH